MAKIYPQALLSTSSSKNMTSKREIFTIWMKSLVFNGNGCTIFDSDGQIIYRIDNYDNKGSDEVYLMDLRDKILFTILRKVRTSTYKSTESLPDSRKGGRASLQDSSVYDMDRARSNLSQVATRLSQVESPYKAESIPSETSHQSLVPCDNSIFKFYSVGSNLLFGICLFGQLKQKQSSSGIVLGDDVLSLVVEPNTDHSLIMGLVVVHGLINHCM
ncbi:protein LURP-one-related 11-like [Magnolia sinica]|uniref:protein LURP-one-related 11-like n=1 Tax=Magnolia sinica TaxID=86752 RepID=UPI00265842C9|nr:protein LURP-one-related 11-like [Magnolia sinica]